MEINFFTAATLVTLMIPIGQFLWTLRGDRVSASAGSTAGRFIVVIGFGISAYAVVGAAMVQGDGDNLLAVEHDRLLARGFDGAALHHATLVVVACGLLAATVRSANVVALAIAATVLGGAAVPAAMKWVFLGPLMRAGVLDIAGAAPVHVLAGSCAMTLARMMRGDDAFAGHRAAGSIEPVKPLALVGAILILAGWIGYMLAAGVLHSPTSAWEGAFNALRAAGAAAVVAMVIAKMVRDSNPAIAVVGAMVTALAMITAAAGRLPPTLAFAVGGGAAIASPGFRVVARRWFGVDDPTALIAAHALGGFVAMMIATPFAVPGESLRLQLAMQTVTAVMAAGAGVFVGLLAGLLGSIRLRWREPAPLVP